LKRSSKANPLNQKEVELILSGEMPKPKKRKVGRPSYNVQMEPELFTVHLSKREPKERTAFLSRAVRCYIELYPEEAE
jgi:hypothetical protein